MKCITFTCTNGDVTVERLAEDIYRLVIWERFGDGRQSILSVYEKDMKSVQSFLKRIEEIRMSKTMFCQLDII